MSTYYVSAGRGLVTGDGSITTPFLTLGEAISIPEHYKTIVVETGTYLEGDMDMLGYDNIRLEARGKVIIDSSGHDRVIISGATSTYIVWDGFTFKNPTVEFFYRLERAYFHNCRFLMTGAKFGALTRPQWLYYSTVRCHKCLFWGISNVGVYGTDVSEYLSCVFVGATTTESTYFTGCAGDNSVIYGATGGINIAEHPVPFTDTTTDPDNPDFSYDPGHPSYSLYMEGSSRHSVIGCHNGVFESDPFSTSWSPYFVNIGFHTNIAQDGDLGNGAWENYEWYFDKTWENINVELGTNDTFQFDEGAGPIDIVIPEGLYESGDDFAAAISTAIIDSSAVNDHLIAFEATGLMSWSSSGMDFSINCNSYSSNDAWDIMGFDTASDKTGKSGYRGDYALCAGAPEEAEDNAAPSVVEFGRARIDFSHSHLATNSEVVSPVIEYYYSKKISSISLEREINSATGEVDSEQATTSRKLFVRASSSMFAMQDVPGTTSLDWTEVPHNSAELSAIITGSYKYWQMRVRLRNDATV